MQGAELIDARQLATPDVHSIDTLRIVKRYILDNTPDLVVCEDYRVYAWESEKHKWNALHTPKLVGMIVALCLLAKIPHKLRMAQAAKTFSTDDKLNSWDLRSKGKRHANDAVRHAVYELVFGEKE